MNPLQQLKEQMPTLTQAEQKAAQYILDQPNTMLIISLTELAKASGASNSAIIRLAQKLGYDGFSEFKFSVRRSLLSGDGESETEGGDTLQKLVDTYVRFLNQLPAALDRQELAAIARAMRKAKHLCLWGVNRTALLAHQLNLRLARLGILSNFTDDTIVMIDQASFLGPDDVCVLFSLQGRGLVNIPKLVPNLRAGGATVVVVTMNPKLPALKYANHSVVLPCISRSDSHNFYEDQIIGYMFIELLLYEISRL